MDAYDRKKLAEQVKARRLAIGMSKEKVARAADVSVITFRRVEDGEPVQDAKLAAILRAINLGGGEDVSVTSKTSGSAPSWNTRKPEGMSDEQHKVIVRETEEYYRFLIERASQEH